MRSLATSLVADADAMLIGGCTSEAETSTPARIDDAPLQILELGPDLAIEMSAAWSARAFTDQTSSAGAYHEGAVFPDAGGGGLEILRTGPDCDSSVDEGNGAAFTFGNVDQFVRATDRDVVDASLGRLSIGTVRYFGCTSECEYSTPDVGVLELSDPADPDRPTIVIIDPYGGFEREQIFVLANSLRSPG